MAFLHNILIFITCVLTLTYAIPDPVIHAGYIGASETNGNTLYYYFVESMNDPSKDPVTMWLSGGPGVSSLTAAYLENGPWLCDADANIYRNEYAWNNQSSVLYIDQPAGSGFSYTGSSTSYVTNETELAVELYTALINWFTIFPEYQNNPFFIFGESYAGKYIPAIAYQIHEGNLESPAITINLQGLGIGDGWISPYLQTITAIDFAVAHGLLGSYEAEKCGKLAQKFTTVYEEAVNGGNSATWRKAADASGDPLDASIDALGVYLAEPAVKAMLNATTDWQFGSAAVQEFLRTDEMKSAEQTLSFLLGNCDLVCNLYGTERMLRNLTWTGKETYKSTAQVPWYVEGETAGFQKEYLNLAHSIVLNAGHQVPAAQPLNSLVMFNEFLNAHAK